MARAEGKADAMEEWLFRNQAMLSPATVRAAAASVGGVKDFAAGYARALEEVKGDVSLGRLLGLQYTPTYYVNGVRFDGAPRPEFLDMAIAWELRRAGKLK
jgi:protein-disulfide isomerase